METNKGFTIIESLISILLLAIVLAGGVSFYHNSDALMSMAMHKKMATEMANSQMEYLKIVPYDNLTNSTTIINVGSLSGGQTVVVTPIDANYKSANVLVNWVETDKNTTQVMNLVTYIAR